MLGKTLKITFQINKASGIFEDENLSSTTRVEVIILSFLIEIRLYEITGSSLFMASQKASSETKKIYSYDTIEIS